MGDDHGWAETGYYGHPHLKTPVMDEMARTGCGWIIFMRASFVFAHAWSVLTGRHPNRYGTFTPGYSLRPQEITIAHLLAKAGYRCGHFGKWHVGPVKKSSPTNPRAMGFFMNMCRTIIFMRWTRLSRAMAVRLSSSKAKARR